MNVPWCGVGRRIAHAFLKSGDHLLMTDSTYHRTRKFCDGILKGFGVETTYYDPLVVYGPWWWPAYQPQVWAPWPGYARPYWSGVSAGFWWGRPVSLSFNFFFGNFDWRQRQVRVAYPNVYYYRAPLAVTRTAGAYASR